MCQEFCMCYLVLTVTPGNSYDDSSMDEQMEVPGG